MHQYHTILYHALPSSRLGKLYHGPKLAHHHDPQFFSLKVKTNMYKILENKISSPSRIIELPQCIHFSNSNLYVVGGYTKITAK